MKQEIIDRLNSLSDEELYQAATQSGELSESSLKYFLNELENRKMIQEKEEIIKKHETFLFELKNKPSNISKISFNINSIILLVISIGPLLDQVYCLSLFSRDPAPKDTTLIMNLVFFAIYFSCFILFIKKQLWSKWIAFSIYTLWTLIAFLIFSKSRSNLNTIVEMLFRAAILIYLISSHKWIKKYQLEYE